MENTSRVARKPGFYKTCSDYPAQFDQIIRCQQKTSMNSPLPAPPRLSTDEMMTVINILNRCHRLIYFFTAWRTPKTFSPDGAHTTLADNLHYQDILHLSHC